MAEENNTPQTEIEVTEEIVEEIIEQSDAEADETEAIDAEEIADESDVEASTLTFKRSHIYAALLPLTFVVGLAVGYIFWGRTTPEATPSAADANTAPVQAEQAAQVQAEPQAQAVQRYDIPEDGDPALGSDEAPITIIEFSDFECPYCRRWHLEVWPQIQATYPDQVRLVYRDFPLSTIHPNATPAAAAANCAGEQDSYWEFNERLFSMELGLDKSAYEQYANQLGLDMDAFNECLDSGRQNDEINGDYEYAANLGVRSTPTFFVNGIPLVGAQPFDVFQNVIEQELAGEIP
ncbi:MAG: DsbA family protein [Anaerolineales bacterium]|nr:DsbA family protein [Chloroflexota bacterium]MBL6980829.1 DsbA family protein [Anaerolineales bacterium]